MPSKKGSGRKWENPDGCLRVAEVSRGKARGGRGLGQFALDDAGRSTKN